jgi:hypothetical protein
MNADARTNHQRNRAVTSADTPPEIHLITKKVDVENIDYSLNRLQFFSRSGEDCW